MIFYGLGFIIVFIMVLALCVGVVMLLVLLPFVLIKRYRGRQR